MAGILRLSRGRSCPILHVEGQYQKDPNTDQHVETALVRVYIAVLTFAAQVQSLYDRSRATLIWKSISGDSLSGLQKSIDEAESHLGRWLEIVDRHERRDRGKQLLEKADRMLTNIDRVMDSLSELNGKMVLAELKIAEEAHYNANTGEEYQECLQGTRTELLQDITNWATDPNKKAVFWLQGMAGTGKSTVSRTVARWLDKEGLLGGSFFFKKGGTDREDAKRLFTTLRNKCWKGYLSSGTSQEGNGTRLLEATTWKNSSMICFSSRSRALILD